MKTRFLLALFLVGLIGFAHAESGFPYRGEWSNGRGETLVIKQDAMRFGKDAPAPYRDITKATDGSYFMLQLTAKEKVNYFSKFLSLSIEGEEMKMKMFNSLQDMKSDENPQGEVTWYRESKK
jgi:hypothetical protein